MALVLCDVRLSLSGEGTAFEQQASSAVLDLMGDEGERLNQHKNMMKWWKIDCILNLSLLFLRPCTSNLPFLAMNQCLCVINRDRKRKRFVRESGKEDQKKKIRTDGGQVIKNKKNRKNLYPSNKISLCTCLLLLLFLFSLTLTIFICIVEVLNHLTTFQLRGVEEEIQGWWHGIGWRNGRREETAGR